MKKITSLFVAFLFSAIFISLSSAGEDTRRYDLRPIDLAGGGFINNSGQLAINVIPELFDSTSNYSLNLRISEERSNVGYGMASQWHNDYPNDDKIVDINDSGTVVGWYDPDITDSFISDPVQPYIWDHINGTRGLGNLFGGSNYKAAAINNTGTVVVNGDNDAYIWDQGHGEAYSVTCTGLDSAGDINNVGQVLGVKDGKAALWEKEMGVKYISELSSVFAINDAGTVLGLHNGKAAIWNELLGVTEIGLFSPDAINNLGAVAGGHFIWDKDHGLADLNSLVSNPFDRFGRKITIVGILDINDPGQILAWGETRFETYGYPVTETLIYTLNPRVIPEPASMFLFGLGGAAALLFKKKKKAV